MWNDVRSKYKRIARALVFVMFVPTATAADVLTLKADEVIDLETKLPQVYGNRTITHAFQISKNFLWFLITPPDFLPQILLRIDKKTGATRQTEIPNRERCSPDWLQVDSLENVYLLRPGRERDTIAVFASDGTRNKDIGMDGRAVSYAVVAGGFVSATREGAVRVHSSDGQVQRTLQAPDTSSFGPGFRLLSLPDGRIVGIDRHDGSGYSLGVMRDVLSSFRLLSDEIEARRARHDRQLLILSSFAADSSCAIWSTLSSVRLREGALVVQTGENGLHMRSYRPLLPQTTRTIDPDGLMAPNLIAVDENNLYLASSNGTVARYSLP